MCASHGRVTDVEPTMMNFYFMHPTPFISLTDLLHQPIIPLSSPSIQTAVEVSEPLSQPLPHVTSAPLHPALGKTSMTSRT